MKNFCLQSFCLFDVKRISKMIVTNVVVIWNGLVVCESDKRFFVQIRLAYQWSCFSRM